MIVPGRVLGLDGGVAASERITLAGLGIGGRGGYVLGVMMDEPVIQFVAIADPQKARREGVKQRTEQKYGPGVEMYRDFREMLPREDIDAVLIATGDRWHTMASIYTAKAGKDIYCEKPCSMTIAESQALADTMRRYNRIYTGRHAAPQHRQFPVRRRTVPHRQARQADHRPRQHAGSVRPPRLAAGRARAGDRRVRLGPVARPDSLAAVQQRLYATAAGAGSSTSTAAASWNGALTPSTSATGPAPTTR